MRLTLAAALLVSSACSSTMTSRWTRPEGKPRELKKLAIVAAVTEPRVRWQIEDLIASELGDEHAEASFHFQPGELAQEPLKAKLVSAGFAGAVAVRIAPVAAEGADGEPPEGLRWGAWPSFEPDHVGENTFVRVETRVYKLPDAELLFASASPTANPTTMPQLIFTAVTTVRDELRLQGIVPRPVPVATCAR